MTKRQQKKLISTCLVLVLLGAGALSEKYNWNTSLSQPLQQASQTVAAGTYRVINVEDGDTITVDMDNQKERVRFIGVDTPEVKDPRKPVQCYGKAASNFTKQLIGNNSVRLEADPQNTNRDRYNRLLRYVYLPDNTLVNAEIIKQGYGFAYTSFPFSKKEQFKQFQDDARQTNKGLWGNCQPEPNKYGGFNSNPEQ